MSDSNEQSKLRLVSLLKEKRPVLMVGAGSSKFVNYPLWHELVTNMANVLTPSLIQKPKELDTDFANRIKERIWQERREAEYHNYLVNVFEPRKEARNHEDFHCNLVKLNCCGLVTTNYDEVLEDAVMDVNHDPGVSQCRALDLCSDERIFVFRFLHDLGSRNDRTTVLHLHGYYRKPKNIILTSDDYVTKYGEKPLLDSAGKLLNPKLDSFHRKVLWSLLTVHSLVFVGFGLEDGFFMNMLQVVQDDFELGADQPHFALLAQDATSDEENTRLEEERMRITLARKGVCPVFYSVPARTASNQPEDHTGLKRLVEELLQLTGIPIESSDMAAITRRMLKR